MEGTIGVQKENLSVSLDGFLSFAVRTMHIELLENKSYRNCLDISFSFLFPVSFVGPRYVLP